LWSIEGLWKVFERFGFLRAGQRRGTHVSVPKIGSRGEVLCFGGILGSYADLRRELNRRNLDLLFFGVLVASPRRATEEGDHLCSLYVFLGEFLSVD
jgi:hypothetical protein